MKSVPTSELEERELVGHWESSDGHRESSGAYLNIYCNGSLSAKMPGDEILNSEINSQGLPTNTTSGLRIVELKPHTLVVASFWPSSPMNYSIQKWPYKNGEQWQMKAEGILWNRTSKDNCR